MICGFSTLNQGLIATDSLPVGVTDLIIYFSIALLIMRGAML